MVMRVGRGTVVRVDRGAVVPFEQLPPRSIALDGFVQGPHVDADGERYSFDHHDRCVRHATRATCEQVFDALRLGLDPEGYTVYVNDVDADTVLSVWLIRHRARALADEQVARLVRVVGAVDALGPSYPLSPPDAQLRDRMFDGACAPATPAFADNGEQTLAACVANVTRLLDGELEAPEATAPPYTITHRGTGWVMARSAGWAFAQLYNAGCERAVVYAPLPDGSYAYTVGKKSEFVGRFPVGPHSREGSILHALAQAEPGWGGGSTIGGAPRNADGSRSRLSPDEVFALVERVVTAR
jgi:hypothetical protein